MIGIEILIGIHCAPTVRAAETAPASVAGEALALCHEADPVTGTERAAERHNLTARFEHPISTFGLRA